LGANLSVENVDAKRNALTLHMGEGTRMALNPARWRGVEVFRPEPRAIAVGDRIQFRAPQRTLKVANGEFATIIALDTAQATLRLDSKREISAPLVQLRHIDLGYASTSHAAQGATVDRVIVNVDAMRSDRLVNARQLYVSMSRARFDAHLYTNDVQPLRRSDRRSAMHHAHGRRQPKQDLVAGALHCKRATAPGADASVCACHARRLRTPATRNLAQPLRFG
jgi:ATP-dependent exoDNAse (exonuclease V) alpha subunit